MKDFFEQCLKDLEAMTGIRQLFFWQKEAEGNLEEAKRKMKVCIEGMIKSSEMFPYIPQDEQQKIIREAMVTDTNYDSMNSRVIWKWLNTHKDVYWGKSQKAQLTEADLTPAEPITPETELLVENWKRSLIGKQVPAMTPMEILIGGQERKDPYLKDLKASQRPEPIPTDPRQEKLYAFAREQKKWLYEVPTWYNIEGLKVPGDDIDDARAIYIEVLMDEK